MLSYLLAGATIGPVVSQTFLDLSIFGIFLCFAIPFFRNKSYVTIHLRKPYIFEYAFIAYIAVIILEFFLLKVTDSESWLRLYKFHWIINFYIFIWAFKNYEIDLTKLVKFFAFAFVIPNIYSVVNVILLQQHFANERLTGLVGSATYHAHGNGLILAFFFPIFYFQLKKLSKPYQIFTAVAVLLMSLSIFLTFTRGIWVSLGLSALLFLFLHNRKFFVAGITASLIALFGLYNLSSTFHERIHHTVQTRTSDHERWDLFKIHVQMFKDSPLTGIGYIDNLSHTPPATWAKYGFPEAGLDSHAHNQLLNVLTLTGILGFIPFVIFYFWFFITNIKLVIKYKTENLQNNYILAMACLIAQLEFLIANFSDVGFEYTKIRSLILMVWALVFVMWQNRIKISQTAAAGK